MRPPGSLDRLAVNEFRPCPPFGRAKHEHRPAWAFLRFRCRLGPRNTLNFTNLRENRIERTGKTLMYERGVFTFNKMWIVTVAPQQLGQFLTGYARQHRGVRDLESVEMEDWEHSPVARGVQEFVGVPTGGQCTRFRLAIADHTRNDQIGIVERGSIGVHQRITQFAAFVDGAW